MIVFGLRDFLLWLWRLDWVETSLSGFIFVIGTIYVAFIGGVIVGGIYLYAISKGVT